MYTRVNMVIHHHRRRYVNKLDLSFVAGRTRGGSSMGTVPKEGRTKRERNDQEMERRTKRGQEIMCKRLSSRTHDPGDRIQIYWFLAYVSKTGRRGEREKGVEFGGPFGVNGSQGFYDLDSEATRASVSSFHGLLICLRSVNARI